MTEPGTEHSHAPREHSPGGMPKWVPVLIGAVLVGMAALAIYTGLRGADDDPSPGKVVSRGQQTATANAPSGEPEAGASLVVHGAQGAAPAANDPVTGQARAVVTGGPGGVTTVVRIWARRGMVLDVLPDDTMVYVNDLPIGQAKQFDAAEEAYEFAATGSYTVRLVPSTGAEKTYIVTAGEDAPNDVARIKADLRAR